MLSLFLIVNIQCFRVICEDGSGRSVSDFLCRNNIFLFLHAVLSHFELTEQQVFNPEDLYLCQDIGKVFRTLSELSHTPKVLKSGVEGFPPRKGNGNNDKLLNKRLKSEKGNYEELEQMYKCNNTEDLYDSFAHRVRVREGKENMYFNEDIYQTIFPPKQPRLSLADTFAGAGKKNKRKAPIEELLSTEDKYLENLIVRFSDIMFLWLV